MTGEEGVTGHSAEQEVLTKDHQRRPRDMAGAGLLRSMWQRDSGVTGSMQDCLGYCKLPARQRSIEQEGARMAGETGLVMDRTSLILKKPDCACFHTYL